MANKSLSINTLFFFSYLICERYERWKYLSSNVKSSKFLIISKIISIKSKDKNYKDIESSLSIEIDKIN